MNTITCRMSPDGENMLLTVAGREESSIVFGSAEGVYAMIDALTQSVAIMLRRQEETKGQFAQDLDDFMRGVK